MFSATPHRLALVLSIASLTGCQSAKLPTDPGLGQRPYVPLPDSRLESIGFFMAQYAKSLGQWNELKLTASKERELRQLHAVERSLQKRTNERFEELLDVLVQSSPINRQTAALGLGFSANDRALTIRKLANVDSSRDDFVQPGHVTPIAAQSGGVLKRAGHTEGSVDLTILAGYQAVAVLAAILDADGELASTPYLLEFAAEHGLKVATIRDLIVHRRRSEKLIELQARADMPTRHGEFTAYAYRSLVDGSPYIAMVMGDVSDGSPTLVRMHSCCVTGDALGSSLCDCGEQLQRAMSMMGGRPPSMRVETLHDVSEAIRKTHLPGLTLRMDAMTEPGLQLFDPNSPDLETPLYLCYHETRRRDPLLQAVIDWATEAFESADAL